MPTDAYSDFGRYELVNEQATDQSHCCCRREIASSLKFEAGELCSAQAQRF